MLFDEAVNMLIQRLDSASTGALHIEVDHGVYWASLITDDLEIEGAAEPVLTDALASLLEVL